jgi:hypothetical protein
LPVAAAASFFDQLSDMSFSTANCSEMPPVRFERP